MHWTDTHNSRSAPTSFSLAEISAEDLRLEALGADGGGRGNMRAKGVSTRQLQVQALQSS